MAKRITGISRIRPGPKRSRVKLGCRIFIFFLVSALLTGACAIAINLQLEDRVNAYYASQREVPP